MEAEQALWVVDHKINQRRIPIDRELAIAIAALATRSAINAEIAALTCGKIMTANQRDKIIKYLCANGCEISSLTEADVNAALENDVPPRLSWSGRLGMIPICRCKLCVPPSAAHRYQQLDRVLITLGLRPYVVELGLLILPLSVK
jgi:hypothetical protein